MRWPGIGVNCSRTATGCSARRTTPRTRCRKCCSAPGRAGRVLRAAARRGPGWSGSPRMLVASLATEAGLTRRHGAEAQPCPLMFRCNRSTSAAPPCPPRVSLSPALPVDTASGHACGAGCRTVARRDHPNDDHQGRASPTQRPWSRLGDSTVTAEDDITHHRRAPLHRDRWAQRHRPIGELRHGQRRRRRRQGSREAAHHLASTRWAATVAGRRGRPHRVRGRRHRLRPVQRGRRHRSHQGFRVQQSRVPRVVLAAPGARVGPARAGRRAVRPTGVLARRCGCHERGRAAAAGAARHLHLGGAQGLPRGVQRARQAGANCGGRRRRLWTPW